jgi:O-antigen ligase
MIRRPLLAACITFFIAASWVLGAVGSSCFGAAGLSAEVLLAALGLLLLFAVRGGVQAAAGRATALRFYAGAAIVLLLLLAYAANPSHRWEQSVGALPIAHVRGLPASASARETLRSALSVATALAVAGLAMTLGRRSVMRLCVFAATASAVTALVVLDQRLSPRPFPVYDWTGFFAYENHYAAFANLVLPVTLCLGERLEYEAFRAGRPSSPAVFCDIAAALSVVAVALSRSRAGLAVTGLLLAGFIFQAARLRRRHPFRRAPVSNIALAGIGLGVAAGAVAWVATLARGWSSAAQFREQLAFRQQVLADALSAWLARPWWGIGPGTFSVVFPYYQTMPQEKFFFHHAHCEPIEFLTEYGILGVALAVVGTVLMLRSGPRSASPSALVPGFNELEGTGFWLALAGVGLHGLVDFPLRHPLNALLAVTWIGMLAGIHRVPRVSGACAVADEAGSASPPHAEAVR